MVNKQFDCFPTKYWQSVSDGRVRCELCPQYCTLREGKRGTCFIRKNHQGEIVLTSYGRSSGFCIDPIEKKPLYHFYPGSRVLSFGTAGCNLGCKFCQNWDISKSREVDTACNTGTPEDIVAAAQKYGCRSLAFTYNDPVIFMEYAIDVAKLAKAQGIHSVAVTAGYICETPREEFFAHIDATNIDLKGFTESFYRKLCHGHLQPVLETLVYLKQETKVWFEITNLIIPGENDDEKQLNEMCQWIAENLGPNIPIHFSAFHPDFKLLNKGKTPLQTLLKARDIATQYGIKYAYCGNVHDKVSDTTLCPQCGSLVIERDWYELGQYKLTNHGECLSCGHQIAGRFDGPKEAFGRRRIPVKL